MKSQNEIYCEGCDTTFSINMEDLDDRYVPKFCVFCGETVDEDGVLWINESNYDPYLPEDDED